MMLGLQQSFSCFSLDTPERLDAGEVLVLCLNGGLCRCMDECVGLGEYPLFGEGLESSGDYLEGLEGSCFWRLKKLW